MMRTSKPMLSEQPGTSGVALLLRNHALHALPRRGAPTPHADRLRVDQENGRLNHAIASPQPARTITSPALSLPNCTARTANLPWSNNDNPIRLAVPNDRRHRNVQ